MKSWQIVVFPTEQTDNKTVWTKDVGFDVKSVSYPSGSLYCLGSMYVNDELFQIRFADAFDLKGSDIVDGAGAVINISSDESTVTIVSDRLGFYPLYYCPRSGVVSNSADVVARKISATINTERLLEFLVYGSLSNGETYYNEVHRVPVGAIIRLRINYEERIEVSCNYYFKPSEIQVNPKITMQSARSRLQRSVSAAMNRIHGEKALFLSSGLDSKFIASHLPKGGALAITFTDSDKIENAGAAAAAKEREFEHLLLERDSKYYFSIIEQAVAMTDGMFEYRHAYTAGFSSELHAQLSNKAVITGCYFDLLLKGLSISGAENWYDKISEVPSKLLPGVISKRKADYQKHCSNTSGLERWRLIPMSCTRTISFRQVLFHTVDFHLLSSHRDFINLALELSPDRKSPLIVSTSQNARVKENLRLFSRKLINLFKTAAPELVVAQMRSLKLYALRLRKRHVSPRRTSWAPIEDIMNSPHLGGVLDQYPVQLKWLETILCMKNLRGFVLSNPDPAFFRVVTLLEWKKGLDGAETENGKNSAIFS